ncbi:MAG: MoaD/ThiS family protein [Armatimonadota bacterium]
MIVRVLLFGHYREAAPVPVGTDGLLTADIPEGSTVATLAETISSLDPRLSDLVSRTRVAVGTEFATLETVLSAGDEVAFLPPMSGG